MTVKGGSRPACAACRFQRRRCSSDCPLAPFFPANQPKIFHNVHRLYGVGNVMKILNQVNDNEQKEEAMKSIKYESYIRQIYPVKGCYGLLVQLHQQLVEGMQELQYVLRLLEMFRKNNSHSKGNSFVLPSLGNDINQDEVVVGGSSSWVPHHMINGGNDLGFYVPSVYNVVWDDQTKTSIDSVENQSQIGEYLVCDDEQDEDKSGLCRNNVHGIERTL